MKDDGSSTGYNYGTAASPKYINQAETGIDTGGPCFPSHCSRCLYLFECTPGFLRV